MISQEEYNLTYANPFLNRLQNLIDKIKGIRKNMDLISWYPNTPDIGEGVDEKGRRFLKVTEFYDLKLDGYWSTNPITISDAIIQLVDSHQEGLKLRNPLKEFQSFKKFILALDHEVKVDYSMDTETIRDNGFPYSRFSSHFSNLKKAINAIKVNQDTIFGTGDPSVDVVEEEPTFEGMTSNQLDIVIKNNNVTSEFVSNMQVKNLLAYRGSLFKAIRLINATPFKKCLNGAKFYIGTKSALATRGMKYTGERVIAHYLYLLDAITYYTDRSGESTAEDKETYITLIHELGHRYHYLFIKNGFKNDKIKNLWIEASKRCSPSLNYNMPKIGDPLSDLREDWWTVRMASNEYYLDNYNKKNRTYEYMNSEGQKITIPVKDIIKRMTCPSKYGAKNEREFFAEMVTLITLGLVKPNQQVVVDKFLQIVNEESL